MIVGQNPGNKLAKAEKHSIPQLTEAQLMELLGI
jgi:NAD-dependent DNA ligase